MTGWLHSWGTESIQGKLSKKCMFWSEATKSKQDERLQQEDCCLGLGVIGCPSFRDGNVLFHLNVESQTVEPEGRYSDFMLLNHRFLLEWKREIL